MHYGEMNKRITVLIQQKIPDQYGGHIVQWEKFANIWAKVDFISEDEEDTRYKQVIKSLYAFTIRNNRDFKMPLKIHYLNKNFIAKKLRFYDNQKKYISIISEMERN